ncbi:semaphorin-4D isoform X2 [Cynocephalus volans]|uniref:semaphorin-4D isoform X2 n=1 Tax=Cynocephalus volans TaxID=110931 RepID=UPI002FC81A84
MRMCTLTGGLLTALVVVFGTAVAFAPVPRITWEHKEVRLVQFHEPGIYNYSALLLSEDEDTLYIGAREAVFAVNALDIAEKQHEVYWKVPEDKKAKCAEKGKSKQTECLNYIRVLQPLSATALYVCGTNAFQPACDHLNLTTFKFLGKNEDGKGRCPFDPAHSYTSVMVDGELYSGTSYNFLGSEPIISRNSSHSPLRTEYAIPWLNEPSFVFADVIRKSPDGSSGEDDRVYFFFTEVSVEYEFVFKLMIPRVARVCKGDQGGLRTLQKKWTSFLKARLICSRPDSSLVFNVLQDVFVLRSPGLKEPVFYALFTPQLNNVGLSAVCTYNLSTAEEVFSRGKYMQSATVEQSHTKWVRYNGPVPKPRPGAGRRFVYAGSNSGVVQAPLAFCRKHSTCQDCVLARDPYCAWSPTASACIVLHQAEGPSRGWIQDMGGEASACPASSPKPFPPPGSSSLSCLGPWPALGSGPNRSTQVTLLPPFLSDQAQQVHELGTFHLFCQATGPADIQFVWEKNGRALETCVPMQTHALLDGSTHALSWLRDAIRDSAEYRCSVLSRAGNKTSKVRVTMMRQEATQQEKWSRELTAWRAVVGEHSRMMQSWRKAWESCSKDTF